MHVAGAVGLNKISKQKKKGQLNNRKIKIAWYMF